LSLKYLEMKSILDRSTSEDVLGRIASLKATQKPQWGQMTVEQMLKHCQQPFIFKSRSPKKRSLKRQLITWFYKPMMYNSKPFRKHLPVPKAYRVDQTDGFDIERQRLATLIESFDHQTTSFPEHAIFGVLTPKQWGIGMFKHLDHHLRQFGV